MGGTGCRAREAFTTPDEMGDAQSCELKALLGDLPGVDLAGMEHFQVLCAFLKCLEQLCREVVESPCLGVFTKRVDVALHDLA